MASSRKVNKNSATSVVIIGATGAVGSEVVKALSRSGRIDKLTMLGRRTLALDRPCESIEQHVIDIIDPGTYAAYLEAHDCAICTLGVAQPSKVSKREFARIDRTAVMDFARAARASGVSRFSLLSSVGASARSSSFYLRSKGELEQGLGALGFTSLSLFRPAFLLTDSNRYGVTQAAILALWPHINPLLPGSLKKYRGIEVSRLGQAIAADALFERQGVQAYSWADFITLSRLYQEAL